jgi:RNA polymerase sigma factor (sigma-70 family)
VAQANLGMVRRHVQTLFNAGTSGGLTDAELLERFLSRTGEAAEAAFAALVDRHGPMVMRVCRSILRERNDAEDAFQATFLVMVRRAQSIRNKNSVVSWLYGVALRVASCQKGAAARRRKHERVAALRAGICVEDEHRDDLGAVLHKELDRLPRKYRDPMILCYFENLSHEQAARRLHWPVGTVRSRLARGREQLRGRIIRRGLAPSAVLVEAVLQAETARIVIPSALANATVRAAVHCASGNSVVTGVITTSVMSLIEGATNVMFISKLKTTALAFGLLATTALVVAQQVGSSVPETRSQVASTPDRGHPAGGSFAPGDDEAVVARELAELDFEVLTDEVRQIRDELEATLRNKFVAARTNPTAARALDQAAAAARTRYREKARELRALERRLKNPALQSGLGAQALTARPAPSGDQVRRDSTTRMAGPHPPAAAIGSIDMAAVFERYEKVKALQSEYNEALRARKNELTRIMTEAQLQGTLLSKLAPGSDDYKKCEQRIVELKAQNSAGREQAEREFAQRQARMTATVLDEIQEVVTTLAQAKGLDYVVKVSPGPQLDSQPDDVTAALNRSVVYADPRNDLTEQVVHQLNSKLH